MPNQRVINIFQLLPTTTAINNVVDLLFGAYLYWINFLFLHLNYFSPQARFF